MARLASPDLEWRIADTQGKLASLRAQVSGQTTRLTLAQRNIVARQQLQQESANLDSLLAEQEELTIRSPVAGRIAEMEEGLKPGAWVPAGEPLMLLVDNTARQVEGFIAEEDHARISPGAEARFIPEDPDIPPARLRLDLLADMAAASLDLAPLASIHGGGVGVRSLSDGTLVPDHAVYRVRLSPLPDQELPMRAVRGRLLISGERESIAARLWRSAVGVLIRESGL